MAIGGLSFWSLAVAETAEQQSRCKELLPAEKAPQAVHFMHRKTVQISPASGPAGIEMHFGRDREPEIQTQTYFLRGAPVPALRIGLLGDIRSEGTGRALPVFKNQLTFAVRRNYGDRRNANVRVCYDPKSPQEAKPGHYVGTLQISAPHASAQALPIVVTVSSGSTTWLVILGLAGALGAWAARAIADAQRGPKELTLHSFGSALIRFRSLAALVLGLCAGVYAAFKLAAPADSTFDGTFLGALPVFGAAFGATVGTKTVTDLFPPSKKEEQLGLAGGELKS